MGLAELPKSQSYEQEKMCEYTMKTYEYKDGSPSHKLMKKGIDTSRSLQYFGQGYQTVAL